MSKRAYTAEFLGALFLSLSIIGSAAMASDLTSDDALQLLIVAIASMTTLALLISLLGPISGAHLNPVVTFVNLSRKQISFHNAIKFTFAQILGAITGAAISNTMFSVPIFSISEIIREGSAILLGEGVATAGLIFTIIVTTNNGRSEILNWAVPLWIFGAYFFTSSTSFANPAITIGRIFTEGITGISPVSVLPFIVAQFLGGFIGLSLSRLIKKD
jgi:arsenate reductase